MSENPFDKEETGDMVKELFRGLVSVTLKAGPYESPWIVLQPDTPENQLKIFGYELKEGEQPLVALMKQTAEAQASFTRIYDQAKGSQPSARGQYGKPAGANDKPGNSSDLPWGGDTGGSAPAKDEPLPDNKCKHGDRTQISYKGQTGWVCPKPKDSPDRCPSIMVS